MTGQETVVEPPAVEPALMATAGNAHNNGSNSLVAIVERIVAEKILDAQIRRQSREQDEDESPRSQRKQRHDRRRERDENSIEAVTDDFCPTAEMEAISTKKELLFPILFRKWAKVVSRETVDAQTLKGLRGLQALLRSIFCLQAEYADAEVLARAEHTTKQMAEAEKSLAKATGRMTRPLLVSVRNVLDSQAPKPARRRDIKSQRWQRWEDMRLRTIFACVAASTDPIETAQLMVADDKLTIEQAKAAIQAAKRPARPSNPAWEFRAIPEKPRPTADNEDKKKKGKKNKGKGKRNEAQTQKDGKTKGQKANGGHEKGQQRQGNRGNGRKKK